MALCQVTLFVSLSFILSLSLPFFLCLRITVVRRHTHTHTHTHSLSLVFAKRTHGHLSDSVPTRLCPPSIAIRRSASLHARQPSVTHTHTHTRTRTRRYTHPLPPFFPPFLPSFIPVTAIASLPHWPLFPPHPHLISASLFAPLPPVLRAAWTTLASSAPAIFGELLVLAPLHQPHNTHTHPPSPSHTHTPRRPRPPAGMSATTSPCSTASSWRQSAAMSS